MKDIIILTINPGSTSTKIAVFNRETPILTTTIKHSTEEISKFNRITDQYNFRKNIIMNRLKESYIDITKIDCIVGRGGLIRPIPSGVYEINEQMKEDLHANLLGEHASNLSGLIAFDLAKSIGTKAYIADPVVVDELDDVARYSGHPALERQSIFHALNQKAIARLHGDYLKRPYEELNLIVVHLGGGISVGAHKKGKVIDVNDGLNGEGPFSPERSGGLTALNLAKLCFSGDYTFSDIKKMIIGHGGLTAYLNTNSVKEVVDRIETGDNKAREVLEAMTYQVAKEIGAMSVVLKGKVDGILLTGGIAYSDLVTSMIRERVKFISEVTIYPGENEMKSLAMNGLRVILGEVEVKTYTK